MKGTHLGYWYSAGTHLSQEDRKVLLLVFLMGFHLWSPGQFLTKAGLRKPIMMSDWATWCSKADMHGSVKPKSPCLRVVVKSYDSCDLRDGGRTLRGYITTHSCRAWCLVRSLPLATHPDVLMSFGCQELRGSILTSFTTITWLLRPDVYFAAGVFS